MLPAKAGFKFKSKIPDFERGKAKIINTPYDLAGRAGTEIGQKGGCKVSQLFNQISPVIENLTITAIARVP